MYELFVVTNLSKSSKCGTVEYSKVFENKDLNIVKQFKRDIIIDLIDNIQRDCRVIDDSICYNDNDNKPTTISYYITKHS